MNIYVLCLIPLYICLAPIFAWEPQIVDNNVICRGTSRGKYDLYELKNPTDCEAAIRMIPSGKLNLDIEATATEDTRAAKKMCVSMEQDGGRRLRVPAAFIAGGCAVLVEAFPPPPGPQLQAPPSLQCPATYMYLRIWPTAKRAAEAILQKCLRPPRSDYEGDIRLSSAFQGTTFRWMITVGSVIPKKGRGKSLYPGFHVYESEELPWEKSGGLGSRREAEANSLHLEGLKFVKNWPVAQKGRN